MSRIIIIYYIKMEKHNLYLSFTKISDNRENNIMSNWE